MGIFYRICWLLVYLPVRLIWPTRVHGKKNLIKKGKSILVCNHYKNSDVFVVGSHVFKQCIFLAKKELANSFFGKHIIGGLNAIFINRQQPELASMKEVIKQLNKGKQIAIFPEGTRNKEGGDMMALKNGVAMFALKGDAPVVPMVFHKPPRIFRFNHMLVGQPITFREFESKKATKENIEIASNKVANAMDRLKTELNDIVDKKKNKNKKSK